MKRRASLRAHIFAGALLWSIGLFLLSSLALTLVMTVHPEAPIVVHGLFARVLPVLAISLGCLFVGFLQVRNGLSAVQLLRERLAMLHSGGAGKLEGRYPSEVQPLVDDLNRLLEERDRAVARAVAKAGDLAHGLKTPLAVLAHEADRARLAGDDDIATSMSQQVDRMRRQVDYHLAHARAAASASSSTPHSSVHESVAGLIRAVERLHAERHLRLESRVPESCLVRARRPDLDEMLGNLLDNACRWARTAVVIDVDPHGDRVSVNVDDDGPGLAPELCEPVLRRGVRADEAGDGSGLGLAIVNDLAELHGGSVALSRSPLGGLRASLTLPT